MEERAAGGRWIRRRLLLAALVLGGVLAVAVAVAIRGPGFHVRILNRGAAAVTGARLLAGPWAHDLADLPPGGYVEVDVPAGNGRTVELVAGGFRGMRRTGWVHPWPDRVGVLFGDGSIAMGDEEILQTPESALGNSLVPPGYLGK